MRRYSILFAILANLVTSVTEAAEDVPPLTSDYVAFCRGGRNGKACGQQLIERMWVLHWNHIFFSDTPGVKFCGPEKTGSDATARTVRDVLTWIASHPETKTQFTEESERAALMALYPCPSE